MGPVELVTRGLAATVTQDAPNQPSRYSQLIPSKYWCMNDLSVTLMIDRLNPLNDTVFSKTNLRRLIQWGKTNDNKGMLMALLEFATGQVTADFRFHKEFRYFEVVDECILQCFQKRPDRITQISLPPNWDKQGLCEEVTPKKAAKGFAFIRHRFLKVVAKVDIKKFKGNAYKICYNYSELKMCLKCDALLGVLPVLLASYFEKEAETQYGGISTLMLEDRNEEDPIMTTPQTKKPVVSSPSPQSDRVVRGQRGHATSSDDIFGSAVARDTTAPSSNTNEVVYDDTNEDPETSNRKKQKRQ